MAIVKYTAVHTTPFSHLRYILNPHKNEEMKFSSGICCTNDYKSVCEEFKELYEHFAKEKFNCRSKESGKNHIRIHSYIQSFDKNVSAELAHKIGVEWAKEMFGENRPVIVSTHTNTDHVHNHIAVCPFDLNGKRWKANKETLALGREISDRLCLENGLKIIDTFNAKRQLSYCEWLARKNNTSWKVAMADDIDSLILSPDVTDIESLVDRMKLLGYSFTDKNRLIAKPHGVKYGCSLYRLGYGYSSYMLNYRIQNKNMEINFGDDLREMQIETAFCLKNIQLEIYRSDSRKVTSTTVYELQRNAELLTFICNKNIRSRTEFERLVNSSAERANRIAYELKTMQANDFPSDQIAKKADELEMNRKRKNDYARNYSAYLKLAENDFERILTEGKTKRQIDEYKENVKDLPDRKNPKEFIEQVIRMSDWARKVIEKAEERDKPPKGHYNYYER